MGNVPTKTLNNGVEIPQLGFGVWQVPPEETSVAVGHALRAGYRSIDTAALYGNEEGVGRAIAESGIDRAELFITTKLWNTEHGYDSTLRAFDESMRKLGLEVLDLYLIHWPAPKQDGYVDTWRAFEKLYGEGRIRAIGVSNFHVPHLERLLRETEIVPAVNQVELHPDFAQAELREFHAKQGIATEAWSPLAQGGLLAEGALVTIAEKYGRTPAQVALRWHLQIGNIAIPKSVTPTRIVENFDVFGFELTADDVAAISALDRGNRLGPNPDDLN
ncbi:2,5-diketo-D-gluconate reductase A [Tamaricihabitans halophyticus]|uniref:2,5-diketo-D-gluconate reductase A n=1 Tax=Tamaricihabitans halophyticus TaxID=1262583 RepID=A0A4R2QPG0_9PSEU|nr:aldo/keto reductase [Tamaricihabitans halophyticus]TCP50834.1 2,5-diketo-D-gluconate reductase A [Tamaricihabitans halophyticus]